MRKIFFARRIRLLAALSSVCNCPQRTRDAQRFAATILKEVREKSAFHRHFCYAPNFRSTNARAKKFHTRRSAGDNDVYAAVQRGAALTHKIKRSHCYFFPAVVIGWQCKSIRDCTAPMSPSTQARRAAMAKKRKTKAAAKKTAKKTTRRKKKK